MKMSRTQKILSHPRESQTVMVDGKIATFTFQLNAFAGDLVD